MMKTSLIAVALFTCACMAPARAAEVREQTYSVGTNVDAQGNITATQFDADVPAGIVNLLTTAMKRWHFVPAQADGRPVAARTSIYVRLKATPDAQGQYTLRISFEGNGPRVDYNSVPPAYPTDARLKRESAYLYLEATAQPDGHLADFSVSNRFEGRLPSPTFKAALLAAAKRWPVTPEQVNGKPVATRIRMPVSFVMPGSVSGPELKMQRELATEDAAKHAAENATPTAPLEDGHVLALDSPLKPLSVASIGDAP